MRKTILVIVGESGSGKTTLSRYLHDRIGYGLVVSYTTRAMRDGETDGIDHNFVTEDVMPPRESMIAYTFFGDRHYWATTSQIDDSPEDVVVYVIDEKGLRFLRERFGDRYDVVSVYVRRRDRAGIDQDRMLRDAGRDVIDESGYDLVIENKDMDLDCFLESAKRGIEALMAEKRKLLL